MFELETGHLLFGGRLVGTQVVLLAADGDEERSAIGAPPRPVGCGTCHGKTLQSRNHMDATVAADRVKELFDQGVEYAVMAERLRCRRSWPAKALAWWHRERGMVPPDGRKRKARLVRRPEAERLADDAKRLLDEG
jgi:hypothetical protein